MKNVSTDTYELTHGRKPRNIYAVWVFELSSGSTFTQSGTYKEAATNAIAANNGKSVKVMS